MKIKYQNLVKYVNMEFYLKHQLKLELFHIDSKVWKNVQGLFFAFGRSNYSNLYCSNCSSLYSESLILLGRATSAADVASGQLTPFVPM